MPRLMACNAPLWRRLPRVSSMAKSAARLFGNFLFFRHRQTASESSSTNQTCQFRSGDKTRLPMTAAGPAPTDSKSRSRLSLRLA